MNISSMDLNIMKPKLYQKKICFSTTAVRNFKLFSWEVAKIYCLKVLQFIYTYIYTKKS